MGGERRRRRLRRADRPREGEPEQVEVVAPEPVPAVRTRPSPADLAGMAGPFALTASVHDPEPTEPVPGAEPRVEPRVTEVRGADLRAEETPNERGLRGLVGGGSSQVNVRAAMRARDASRPSDDDLAEAERALTIVRRGWIPREDLPRPGHRG
jgi:hypothetical protein